MTQLNDVGQQVTSALMDDPRTKEAVIEVSNDRGILTLIGTVDSEETRQAAEAIARQQPGVVSVVNELKVE